MRWWTGRKRNFWPVSSKGVYWLGVTFSISILIAGETKNGRAKSTRWSVWQSCFWGCDMTLGTHPAASKVRQKTWNHRKQEGWHKHPRAELGRTAFGSPNSIYFSNPKNGHQTNRTVHVTSSCACCGFLRSRLESQSWNSFNPFPIVNRVSAGVPTPARLRS